MNQPILNMGAGRSVPVGFDLRVVHLLHSRVLHDIETGRIGPDTVRRSRRSVEGEPVAPAMPPSVGG